MGTLYYALNAELTQACELGKNWFEGLSDRDWKHSELVAFLTRHFSSDHYDQSVATDPEYVEFVARQLLSLGTRFTVVSEHERDKPEYAQTMVTRSRFKDDQEWTGYPFYREY